MPSMVKLRLGPFIMEVQYFDELLMDKEKGVLPRDMAAHALWYYYICAMQAYTKAKANMVLEDEPSLIWNVDRARNLLQSISNLYGTPVLDMVKYWSQCERQRIQLGGGDTLPSEFKFQFNGVH